jgi:hypothetical protein
MGIHAGAARNLAGRTFTAGTFRQVERSVAHPPTRVAPLSARRQPLPGGGGRLRQS